MQIDIGASLQCNNTHMDEPTTAEKSEKSRGARQEGIPVGIVTGGPVEYASLNCDTVIYDIQKAEQEIYETLRVIQRECYDEAMARGVSTALAKLR